MQGLRRRSATAGGLSFVLRGCSSTIALLQCCQICAGRHRWMSKISRVQFRAGPPSSQCDRSAQEP